MPTDNSKRPRIPLAFVDHEWRLPCGCAFHWWNGEPDYEYTVEYGHTYRGNVEPHGHACPKHAEEWSK